MRRSDLPLRRILPLGLMLTLTILAHGQAMKGGLPSRIPGNAAKTAAEAAQRLEKAKANHEAEEARTAATVVPLKRMQAVVDQARETGPTQPSFAERSKTEDSRKRLQEAMSRVSPEGKAILAQSGATPTLRTPQDSIGTTSGGGSKASPLSSGGAGPKPQPLKATPIAPTEKPPARTVIDAGTSFFDSKAGFGVFVEDVVVDHPEFHLTSDELEIYMNKDESKDKAKDGEKGKEGAATEEAPQGSITAGELAQQGAAEATSSKGQPAPSERKAGGNIKTAIAKGRKVFIIKMSPEGEPQTGIGREAVYDGATGDMILRGWPQIQKGNNLTVATEPTTYFIIKADGHFYAQGGRAQTRIVQDDQKQAPPPPPGGASTTPARPAPPPPVLGNKPQGGPQ